MIERRREFLGLEELRLLVREPSALIRRRALRSKEANS